MSNLNDYYTELNRRRVYAPQPEPFPRSTTGPLSAMVGDDEEVEWLFYYGVNGERWAYGYRMVKKSKRNAD